MRNHSKNLHILFEDTYIIVCEKPHGLATQSRRIGSPDMENLIKRHLYEKFSGNAGQKEPYLAVIHRLDQPVRGILVFAKTPAAARELNRELQNGDFGKYYLALTSHTPAEASGTLEHYLYKDSKTNTASICTPEKKGAKRARLSYEVCNSLINFYQNVAPDFKAGSGDMALLKVHLDTGRFHQIRCQLSAIGCPIVGDTKYNPTCQNTKGWQTLCLCAYRLEFLHPVTHKEMTFSLI